MTTASREAKTEEMVCEATAAVVMAIPFSGETTGETVREERMSPSWQVTAVHGRAPMNAPTAHWMSERRGRARPAKTLMLDQGTIPIRRRSARRAHGEEARVVLEEGPSRAMRVNVVTEGKKRVRSGASGAARIVAIREPSVVRVVWRRMARAGGRSAPVRMF